MRSGIREIYVGLGLGTALKATEIILVS